MMAPWADVLYACDRKWWLQHFDKAHQRCGGEFWTTSDAAASIFNINYVESEPGGGMSPREGFIRQGGNSGFQAVGLALLFGAARIVLLGYDMQFSQKKSHWHGDHQGDLNNPQPSIFPAWVEHFAKLKADTSAEIINCSRESALDCFEREPLETCLARVTR